MLYVTLSLKFTGGGGGGVRGGNGVERNEMTEIRYKSTVK